MAKYSTKVPFYSRDLLMYDLVLLLAQFAPPPKIINKKCCEASTKTNLQTPPDGFWKLISMVNLCSMQCTGVRKKKKKRSRNPHQICVLWFESSTITLSIVDCFVCKAKDCLFASAYDTPWLRYSHWLIIKKWGCQHGVCTAVKHSLQDIFPSIGWDFSNWTVFFLDTLGI